ncbi:MAG: hypothetical protein JXQ87_04305 [Bacteroidia bacterium]
MKEFEQINRVKAPDHLWQNIEAIIEKANNEVAPLTWYWLAAASFIILITVNVAVLTSNNSNTNQVESYVESIEINVSNQLYNE